MPAIISKLPSGYHSLAADSKYNWYLLYLSYFSSQMGRGIANMSLTLGAQQAGAMTSTQTTQLVTAGSFAYTFGKIFGGSCADILGGKRTIGMVLTTMGACFLAKGFTASSSNKGKVSVKTITFLWCLSRIFHATHWPAHCVVNKAWFSMDSNFSSSTAILSTCSRLGSFSGSLIGGILLAKFGSWATCLKLIGTYMMGIGVVDIYSLYQPTLKDIEAGKKVEKNGVAAAVAAATTTVATSKLKSKLKPGAWKRALTNPKLYLVFAGNALCFPAYDLPAILPVILSEHVQGLTTANIGLISSMFPLMAVPSIFFGAWIEPKLTSKTRPMFYAAGASIASMCLFRLSQKGLSPTSVAPLLMATMFSFAPAVAFVPPEFLAKFGGPQTGLFTGLNDAGGMLLNSSMYAFLPTLKKRGGWSLVLKTYAGMMAVSGFCNAGYYILEGINPLVVSPFDEVMDR